MNKGLLVVSVLAAGLIGAVIMASVRTSGSNDVVSQNHQRNAQPESVLVSAVTGDRPNIVLIIACTLRKDMLSPYGGLPGVSPCLSRKAAHGTRFDNA